MDGQFKTVDLRARAEPFLASLANRMAKEAGVNRSEFIRQVVLDEAKRRGLVRDSGSKLSESKEKTNENGSK